ncbi:MAG: DUF6036 family nucleotidyltransferase [Opitutaceae bacterium]|jgi:hypothetical protein
MRPYLDLSNALSLLLDRLDETLRKGGYSGEPIRMYLAGGMALNYHCGSRYTADVDAIFSKRFHVQEVTIDYKLPNGTPSWLTLDANYNPTFGLLHEDYERDALEWTGIGNEKRLIHLYVLAPLDLAVSKIARFSPQDREDILTLASSGFFTAEQLKARATESLANFVGDLNTLRSSIEIICRRISELPQSQRVQ